ncbi:MAG: alpha-L-rhamnosidase [Hespellia sp.]|nr:alpha-L-rhamnosidase [Hespellia sp.]
MDYENECSCSKGRWIWYPGDFEIYHGMLQNFSREEREFFWPAYWQIDGCRKNVHFQKTYLIEANTQCTVFANCQGYVCINGQKHKFQDQIRIVPGMVKVEVFAGSPDLVPAILVQGEVIYTGAGWMADDFITEPVNAGWNERYRESEQNPAIWEYEEQTIKPVMVAEKNGGTLYDFGTELTAELDVKVLSKTEKGIHKLICYGESQEEAMDTINCYYSETIESLEICLRRRAFRYVFIPETGSEDCILCARHLYVDIPVKAAFYCEDKQINQIWETSVRTFQLCSGIFFIDGVKRDRWIWSGDAYQSYFVNPYVFFDEEINKRTILALRGNDPVRQHINTIVDYSMYWVLGIGKHYEMTADREFLEMIYPRMVTMMEFLESQLDENGFLVGRKNDWIFIDWAEIDKDGPVCAEQMLLAACYHAMNFAAELLGDPNHEYELKYRRLISSINAFYWDVEKQAYIDSYTSGKRHVSRHANIFAILFEIADEKRTTQICRHVLQNEKVPQITTPYFKFYELEVMCLLGKQEEVLKKIRAYWGGMLTQGAVTFWEEYDPAKENGKEYEMYGDPYGKSLCHAWAASPIYLLGRYYIGLKPTSTGYETFEISPNIKMFREISCRLPVKNGSVYVEWRENQLRIETDRDGGSLTYCGNTYPLYKGKAVMIKNNSCETEKE